MFYTGLGDNGRTSVLNCKKFSKSSPRIEALGALDELNSLLGICTTKNVKSSVFNILEDVQNDLFVIQAEVAGSTSTSLGPSRVKKIEMAIDKIAKKLPKIKNFTLSGGTELSALLDYSRAVARRTERRVVGLGPNKSFREPVKYLNRLSSLLYVLARQANNNRGIKEKKPRY